jgi:hypothetical protein
MLSATVQYSLTAAPVLNVPTKESNNETLMNMITSNPNLFKVNCQINVDHFAELLMDHLNQPFVKLVCCALHESFWPF